MSLKPGKQIYAPDTGYAWNLTVLRKMDIVSQYVAMRVFHVLSDTDWSGRDRK